MKPADISKEKKNLKMKKETEEKRKKE